MFRAGSESSLKIVILGLSITSAWGNGHATTYRALVRALTRRGHQVVFLERDVPWYAVHRDLPEPPWGYTHLYASLEALTAHAPLLAQADVVMLGSYVPEGIQVAQWLFENARGLVAFYDIDTPVTLAALARGDCAYLTADLIPEFDLYLSFTGGPLLARLEREYGARAARPLYCSVDPDGYYPETIPLRYDLGYLGTYSPDRQDALERLLLEPARRQPRSAWVVAGPQYPEYLRWPSNVERIEHLAPRDHHGFYNTQRFTLNLTRADMIQAGYSPSVRLFEAAACGVPILSDRWVGLEAFFTPDEEILVADTTEDVLHYIALTEAERVGIAKQARTRVLAEHTAEQRVQALEGYVSEVSSQGPRVGPACLAPVHPVREEVSHECRVQADHGPQGNPPVGRGA